MNQTFELFMVTSRVYLETLWNKLRKISKIREYFDDDFNAFALEVYVNTDFPKNENNHSRN